jgi:hypothetical protein
MYNVFTRKGERERLREPISYSVFKEQCDMKNAFVFWDAGGYDLREPPGVFMSPCGSRSLKS